MRLTADQALEACRTLGLDYEADLRQPDGLWMARCPACVLYADKLTLTIREPERGRPVTVSCRTGCEPSDILARLAAELRPAGMPGESLPLRFLDMVQMVGEPPPVVPWLAPPVIPRASLTALFAPGGDGKSLLAAGLACAIRDGGEIAGISCETGTTIYLDAENGEHEIWRRVHTLGMPATGIQVADASGFDLRRHIDVLRNVILEHKPDLVVLDSLRSLTPGLDENDTKQTAGVIDPLRRLFHELGPAGLLIHHTNKSGKDVRGASSIRDAVDVLWHLGRHDGDKDTQRRFLACRKMRIAAEPERMWLRLAVDRGRVLIDQAEPPEDDGPSLATAQPVRTMLSDQILASMSGAPLRLAEIAKLVERQPKDGSVRNALAGLVADGLMLRDGTTYTKVHSEVQVQTKAIAPLHQEVQCANPLKGDAPLHLPTNVLTADCEVEA